MKKMDVKEMLEGYMKELNELRDKWKDLDVDENEYEDYTDYLDDGDDMGECVSSIREENNIVVYKQLVDTTHREYIGEFKNHYEAFEYIERQGVYEKYWRDMFGREWEIIFEDYGMML